MTKVIKSQIAKVEHGEKKIFWILFTVFVFLVVYYGFLVGSSVINAVNKQQTDKKITMLSSEINSMESEYIKLKNSITMDKAFSLGFVSLKKSNFAAVSSVSSLSLSASGNNQ